jgi:hypothetical protein
VTKQMENTEEGEEERWSEHKKEQDVTKQMENTEEGEEERWGIHKKWRRRLTKTNEAKTAKRRTECDSKNGDQ